MHSETASSEQTLRDRRVWKRAAAGRRASTDSTANMSEEKQSWDRVPAWDGDKHQWERYLRDAELYLQRVARLLSRLTGSARKYAETNELDKVRRSTGENKNTHEGVAGVKYVLKLLERVMGIEKATKTGQVLEFFYKKLQRRPGQTMAEWVNAIAKAVLDMKAEGLNVELKNMGGHLFEKSNLTLERQERVLGCAEGECEFATIRGDRKPGHVTDPETNDRFRSRFHKPRDGKTGRYTAHETDAHDAKE